MKIIVKISDVEVTIDRPDFKEFNSDTYQKFQTNDCIIPLVKQATESAKELYNNRIEKLNQDTYDTD